MSADVDILTRYYERHVNEVSNLMEGFVALNDALTESLDRHHTIGHAFFMAGNFTRGDLERVWRRKIRPLIEEYFFDQPDIAEAFTMERFWSE